MNIGFLGTGRIAAPMVEALAGRGHELSVSERSAATAADLAGRYQDVSIRSNDAVVDRSDVVVICLLADVAREVLPGLSFRADHKVISVMADIALDEITGLIGGTGELSVMLPYPFIRSGDCPLAVYPASPVLQELFGDRNMIVPLDSEQDMTLYFAASAVTSTMLAALQVVSGWLGQHAGDQPAAERYVTALVGGYLKSLPADGAGRLGEAAADLATEGGLNAQLLSHMKEAGLMEALGDGLEELLKR